MKNSRVLPEEVCLATKSSRGKVLQAMREVSYAMTEHGKKCNPPIKVGGYGGKGQVPRFFFVTDDPIESKMIADDRMSHTNTILRHFLDKAFGVYDNKTVGILSIGQARMEALQNGRIPEGDKKKLEDRRE
jgi:hypothetical protein